VARAEIKVILGSDVTEIIIPREVREGLRVSLSGIKTKLGWTVTGTLPRYILAIQNPYVSFMWLHLNKN